MKTISIHNLSTSTPQEVFNFIARHLLTQNKRSVPEHRPYGCRYKFEELKCAAGILIPDENYNPVIEGFPWRSVIVELSQEIESLDLCDAEAHVDLITRLQSIHDNREPEKWSTELYKLALEFNLTFNLNEIMETNQTQTIEQVREYEKMMGFPHSEEVEAVANLFNPE